MLAFLQENKSKSRMIQGAVVYALLISLIVLAGCSSGGNNAPPPDTTAPTAPTGFTATAASSTQINLSWTASTDNVGVAGYRVERCQGAGCSTFTQVGTASGTTFNDTGLTLGTVYAYRVRATDAANNLSAFSSTATATTPDPGAPISVTITPKRGGLTVSQTVAFAATVTNDIGSQGVTWRATGGTLSGQTVSAATFSTAAAGSFTITATSVADNTKNASVTIGVTDLAGVFTHQNDPQRTGQNLKEYALTTSNVSASTFGKLFSCSVDGEVYAQPLYFANLSISGGTHNVVFVATEHDSVYAFDADTTPCLQYWKVSLLAAGETTVPPADTGETGDLTPEIGITSTPVIDPATSTIYICAKSKDASSNYHHRLHALNVATGAEKTSSPMDITATSFDPLIHMQRPALLLSGTTVYLAFGSHGDQGNYHGWVLGYNKTTLGQNFAWASTDLSVFGTWGGIWGSGAGPAADANGNVWVETGNGDFDGNTGGPNYGDSVVKLSGAGAVLDFFTPSDQDTFRANDIDLGSGGVMMLPGSVG